MYLLQTFRMQRILFFIFILIKCASQAQSYFITSLTVEEGLSNNNVLGITQDKEGSLWFATEEGLSKFDGNGFRNSYKYMHRLSGDELNTVYADPHDPVIWIATQRAGLNAWNYRDDSLTVYTHDPADETSLMTNDVTDISPASKPGNLWISTYHKGVNYFDKATQTFTPYNATAIPGLPADGAWCATEAADGSLLIGHIGEGMSRISLSDKRVTRYRHDPQDPHTLPSDHVVCIYRDREDRMWVGTNRGLALFDPETDTFIRLPLHSMVFGLCHTDDNKLWISTESNGVYILNLKPSLFVSPKDVSLQHIPVGNDSYTLSNPNTRCVFQDSYRNVWIGTYGGGINFVSHSPPLFSTYGYSPRAEDTRSLNNRNVLSLCTDARNTVWIGTDGEGVNLFQKGERTAIYNRIGPQQELGPVLSLFTDSRKRVWLGTFKSGAFVREAGSETLRSVSLRDSYDKDIRCFYEDARHHLWIGNSSGLFKLDPQSFQTLAHYHTANSPLPDNLVRCVTGDDSGRLWIGTFGEGLCVVTPAEHDLEPVVLFSEKKGFCSNRINHIFKDSGGAIWVATSDGLACFPTSDLLHYKVFGREDGLANTFIRAITEDAQGNLWFSTNQGISCYLRNWSQFLHYHSINHVPMGNFSNGAVTQDAEGKIYFGSTNGARHFDPVEVLREHPVAPVWITDLKMYDGTAEDQQEQSFNFYGGGEPKVRLNYRQNTFRISFTVQDFSQSGQVEYCYRLKGLDDTWYEVSENNVTFRNLPPGLYEFQVNARFPNQEWSPSPSSLLIRIHPPFWWTWWAKSIYTLGAAGFLFILFYMYKKKVDAQSSYALEKQNHAREQELNQERLRFYTNITHELRTPLTLILGPLEDLRREGTSLASHPKKMDLIHQNAVRLLNLINQLLEFRKTETQNKKLSVRKENIAQVVRETGLKYKELNTNPEITYTIQLETESLFLYFDKEVVTMILDNLLSNARKYTRKGSVEVSLSTLSCPEPGRERVCIRVKDTGEGIPADELPFVFDRYYQGKKGAHSSGTGIGLSLVRNLVSLHEGEIQVESVPGQGTVFSFSLPLHAMYPQALHADANPQENPFSKEEEKPMDGDNFRLPSRPLLLIVEDNREICEYLQGTLSEWFEILTAQEGETACALAVDRVPDVIVSDIMMPGMDGLMFCKRMKEDVRTSHIPLILLTARDTPDQKEEGYGAGADSYLTKPFSTSLLKSRIFNLLESRKKLTSQFSAGWNRPDKRELLHHSLSQLDQEFLQRVDQLIETELGSEKIDVAYLSDKLCMSKSTLYRKMKGLTGLSMNEYVRKIKMRQAEQFLLEGKYSVSEVAYRVGMNSPVYFRQCFKETFGVSPSRYMQHLKESGPQKAPGPTPDSSA